MMKEPEQVTTESNGDVNAFCFLTAERSEKPLARRKKALFNSSAIRDELVLIGTRR